MGTVRIYKIAELLDTTSPEIVALLKRDHGIDVKSASSTVEEMVARQFVERLAKKRGIALPSGDIFAEGAAAKVKKAAAGKKAAPAPPPPPSKPSLPPPRLVKTHKAPPTPAPAEAEAVHEAAAAEAPAEAPMPATTPNNAIAYGMGRDPETGEKLLDVMDFVKYGLPVTIMAWLILWFWTIFGYWKFMSWPTV